MPAPSPTPAIANDPRPRPAGSTAYLWSTLGVAAAIAAAFLLKLLVPHANLSLVFLTGVLVVATRWGFGPSLYAGALSFLAYNFFFTPPHYTFQVHDDADVAGLLFFLVVAALTGKLAARMHDEAARSRSGLERIGSLYAFSKRMSAAAETDDVLRELAQHLSGLFDCPVATLLPRPDGSLAVNAGHPVENTIELPMHHLESAWRAHHSPAPLAGMVFFTLGTSRGPVGLVAIKRDILEADQWDQTRALCDQAAVAVERTALVGDLEQARLAAETEQLRSALLSSVSHDLRTPLSSIIGSTSSLLEYGDGIGEAGRRELLRTVLNEAERLNRYIQNLLDMTRLGQGQLSLRRDWVGLEDIVSAAVNRLAPELERFQFQIEIAPGIPLLHVHGAFVEQALFNLLDNAVTYSPPGGTIRVIGRAAEGSVVVDVTDQGAGIPEEEREKIFDMFYSLRGGDRRQEGTGLGLSICRGLIGAHGGEVHALDSVEGPGTCMRITLPIAETAARETAA